MNHTIRQFFILVILVITLLQHSATWLRAAPQETVIGDGTPAGCDNNALGAALANGGTIRFNCGPAAHTILADTYEITSDTELDGGDLITLDGENLRQIFIVHADVTFTLRNITLAHGMGSTGPGGAIWNYGNLLIQKSTLRENGTEGVLAGGALANETTGTMTIEDSLLEGNYAADAGAIYTRGPSLTLHNTTVRNNYVREQGAGFYGGGGILQEITTEGVVTLINSTIEGNRSNPVGSPGGGIALLTGRLVVDSSTFTGNLGYGNGGALFMLPDTTAEIRGSTFAANSTIISPDSPVYVGGAIYNNGGTLAITASTFQGNRADNYGAIANSGTLTLEKSTLTENRANTGYGGGLGMITGNATVAETTFANNEATTNIGGGIAVIDGTLLIERSTIRNNRAAWGGGGLYVNPNAAADVTVRDSEITGNSTSAQNPPISSPNVFGGGIYGSRNVTLDRVTIADNEAATGAGLFYYQGTGTLVVRDSTVSNNEATHAAGGISLSGVNHTLTNVTVSGNRAAGYAGGILNDGTSTVESSTIYGNVAADGDNVVNRAALTLRNTIVAAPLGVGVNCGIGSTPQPLTSGGHNLLSDASCNLTAEGDQQRVDPLLEPLADNGGPTRTHLPQPGSPAIDAGDGCPLADQRGVSRPQGAACDIGAVESGADAPASVPFTHAQLDGGVKPTIGVNPANGAVGATVVVQGQGNANAPSVRLAWSQNGAVQTVAEVPVDGQQHYRFDLVVPTGLEPGAAEICATLSGMAVAEYACTPFTINEPEAAAISGELPAAVIQGTNAQLHLLNAAGNVAYSTSIAQSGSFALNNVTPGYYRYAVTGALNQQVNGGVAKIVPGANQFASDRFNFAGFLTDPCVFKGSSAGAFGANPSHSTFFDRIVSDRVSDIQRYLRLPLQAAATNASNFDDTYFGIYMSGVNLNVEFTADPQIQAGKSVARVRFTIFKADNSFVSLPDSTGTPYRATFNVGSLPVGTHKIQALALDANGAQIGGLCNDIVVTSGILPDNVLAADSSQVDTIQRGWQWRPDPKDPTNPAKRTLYYYVRGFLPQNQSWPPNPMPNPPPTWPLIGTVDNRAGLRMYIDVEMDLNGEVRFNLVRTDLYAKLLSTELCNNSRELLRNYRTKISYQNPNGLYIPLNGGTLCSFYRERTFFRGEIESLWGLLSFGVGIRARFDGSIAFSGSMRPMAGDFRANTFGTFNPALIVDGWVKLFWGVAGGGITPYANVVSFASVNLNTTASPPLNTVACAAAVVSVNVWARVNYLVGSKTWNLWNKKLLEQSTCLQAEQVVAAMQQEEPAPPRVVAAPAIASSATGAEISLYVEDAAPTAPVTRAQLMARFRSDDSQPWGDPVALTDGTYLVQDPAVVFYENGQALAAWTETIITPEADQAATTLGEILRRQEIVYAFWDGNQWSTPIRFTTDEAADGSVTLASRGRYVTMAWVRDLDGDPATRTDWRIATAQLDGQNNEWITAYLLDAADSLVNASNTTGTLDGLNAEVKLAYDDRATDPMLYATWTFDTDGALDTGLDRRVIVARWNVIDEVALNPQPLPPKDWAALNPQPLPPKDWVMIDPQPLPPRVQSPTLSFADGVLRLAFLVNEPDTDGGELPVTVGAQLWTATLGADGQSWQANALRDAAGNGIIAEAPSFAAHNSEQLLLFRRFGEQGTTGALGQLSLSRMVGRAAPSTPLYLTTAATQNWQGALAINQLSGQAQIVKVARLGGTNVQAAAQLAPATTQALMQTASATLTAAADPVETLQLAEGADPALDPLTLSRRAAPAGSTVTVMVTVRNVGRGTTSDLTVNLYSGLPGNGTLLESAAVPRSLTLNESDTLDFAVTVPAGPGDLYAELDTSGENLSTANDLAQIQLSQPSAPTLNTLVEDELFTGNLRLSWVGIADEAVAGYRIERSATATGSYEFIGEAQGYTYTDLLSEPGVSYCYRVRAYTSGGVLSAASGVLCGETEVVENTERIFLPVIKR